MGYNLDVCACKYKNVLFYRSLAGLPKLSNDEQYLCDVWDGAVLREWAKSGQFFCLDLSLSIDGVSIFNSSAISMWPVFLVILNFLATVRPECYFVSHLDWSI